MACTPRWCTCSRCPAAGSPTSFGASARRSSSEAASSPPDIFRWPFPRSPTFYLGLLLIVIGTGLLKPNVSAMVADLYPEGGARRDAGFSIFYMGINLGGFLGPLLCGLIGERYNFHLGFSLAGIGMVLGLIQYRLGGKHLAQAGLFKSDEPAAVLAGRRKMFYMAVGAAAAWRLHSAVLAYSGALAVSIQDARRMARREHPDPERLIFSVSVSRRAA